MVRQLTGRSQFTVNAYDYPAITTTSLNNRFAAISSEVDHKALSIKNTVNNQLVSSHILDWRMFENLDMLRQTTTGLDGIQAWFLRVGYPFFAAPVCICHCLHQLFPHSGNQLPLLPLPKYSRQPHPLSRPISIISVLSRILECIVVHDNIYPSI